jgi:hypothetical protein
MIARSRTKPNFFVIGTYESISEEDDEEDPPTAASESDEESVVTPPAPLSLDLHDRPLHSSLFQGQASLVVSSTPRFVRDEGVQTWTHEPAGAQTQPVTVEPCQHNSNLFCHGKDYEGSRASVSASSFVSEEYYGGHLRRLRRGEIETDGAARPNADDCRLRQSRRDRTPVGAKEPPALRSLSRRAAVATWIDEGRGLAGSASISVGRIASPGREREERREQSSARVSPRRHHQVRPQAQAQLDSSGLLEQRLAGIERTLEKVLQHTNTRGTNDEVHRSQKQQPVESSVPDGAKGASGGWGPHREGSGALATRATKHCTGAIDELHGTLKQIQAIEAKPFLEKWREVSEHFASIVASSSLSPVAPAAAEDPVHPSEGTSSSVREGRRRMFSSSPERRARLYAGYTSPLSLLQHQLQN